MTASIPTLSPPSLTPAYILINLNANSPQYEVNKIGDMIHFRFNVVLFMIHGVLMVLVVLNRFC